jgi:putative PIN family toxin of toxin-antitoxin system
MRGAAHGRLRVVLDTNVLISALHFPDGTLSGLWEPLYDERFRLILSPAIVIELTEKLRGKFGWEEHEFQRLLRVLVRKAEIVRPTVVPEAVPGDTDDNEIVACAVDGKADVIVSGDRHLLKLREYQRIPIVRPMDLLRMVGDLR